MLAALVLCGLAALTSAQQPKPCVSPPQFVARRFESDYQRNFTGFASISYDETNKRVREIEEIQIGTDQEFFDVLRLYTFQREYRVNLRTRKCNSTSITRPFFPAGVPPDATYGGEFVVGPVNINNEHVDIIAFNGKTPEGDDYFTTVTSPDCIPVSGGVFSKRFGFFHVQFFDVTIGIPDPTVFNIPRECL